ncbi:response regulator [Phenylobacterium immobile]|uniref:response regulator n=1 Tax=Phenylobacterium immobile TaxID=21 RepID=UPI000B0CBF4D|nr:response regulator [Phenylobacterium immobile]
MTGTPQRAHLLLVDDEPDILVALTDLLEDTYEISTFTSPPEALAFLAAGAAIDVIVSDQRMPQMTGDVFLAQARTLTDADAILLTGYADLSAVTAALNQGGIVGYAAKPWEPKGLTAMIASAVERRTLRAALAREQALLRGLMESLPAAVAFKDADGRFVQLNDAKAQAMGVVREMALGLREQQVTGAAPGEAETIALSEGRTVQVVVETEGPAPRWTQFTAVPIGPTATPTHVAIVEHDITEQRLAEQQLRQSDKLRALGTLAGGVAHDFNNLLTAILGGLELAARKLHDEEAVRRYLDNATLAAQKGAALTQRLLGFSRQTDSRPSVVRIGELMDGAQDLVVRTLGASVATDWRIDDDLWPTAIEADQLELALLNLAINARDAMPGGGVITLTARNLTLIDPQPPLDVTPGDYVVLSVGDTGEGMTPEVMARVLEPFFTTKPVGKGTGLGLPMVYGFAQRSGGALTIDSEPGAGSTISLYLPRCADPLAGDAAETGAQDARGSTRACVLVVDDEPAVRGVTASFLNDLGHAVVEAEGPDRALEILQARDDLDLVLVDFAMPGMNGVDLALRARALRPGLPVILLTGYFDVEAAPKDMPVLYKPFTEATLRRAVDEALADPIAG